MFSDFRSILVDQVPCQAINNLGAHLTKVIIILRVALAAVEGPFKE
ncbi:MAG TPA: hypothetical protein VE619_01830 [Nitrososphaeraceae archaeon]|nr:hypothetical protein [Nitrososphaeraceae archaeon]